MSRRVHPRFSLSERSICCRAAQCAVRAHGSIRYVLGLSRLDVILKPVLLGNDHCVILLVDLTAPSQRVCQFNPHKSTNWQEEVPKFWQRSLQTGVDFVNQVNAVKFLIPFVGYRTVSTLMDTLLSRLFLCLIFNAESRTAYVNSA